jgi:hypothetical protein
VAAPTSNADSGVENPELLIAKLARERDEYKKLVRLLQEENERLERGLMGQKAERLHVTTRSCRRQFSS